MWRGIQLLTMPLYEKVKQQLFFFSKLATGSFLNAPYSRLKIHKISEELKRYVRTEKTEEKNTSCSLQCSQDVTGASLKDEGIIGA